MRKRRKAAGQGLPATGRCMQRVGLGLFIGLTATLLIAAASSQMPNGDHEGVARQRAELALRSYGSSPALPDLNAHPKSDGWLVLAHFPMDAARSGYFSPVASFDVGVTGRVTRTANAARERSETDNTLIRSQHQAKAAVLLSLLDTGELGNVVCEVSGFRGEDGYSFVYVLLSKEKPAAYYLVVVPDIGDVQILQTFQGRLRVAKE